MLRKIIITTLIIVGLSNQSTAIETETGGGLPTEAKIRDFTTKIPGFTFTRRGLFQLFTMRASEGIIKGFGSMRNTTAWRPSFSNNSSSIAQTVQFPNLNAYYDDTTTALGLIKSRGQLSANLSDSNIILTLTATSSENGTCVMDIQALIDQLSTNLDTSNLGLVGILLQALLAALSGIVTTLVGVLTGVLPQILTSLLGQEIANTLDVDEICKMLLEGNMTNFPEPIMSF